MADYDEMTKDELQAELDARDLPVSGNKDELIARLELDDAEGEETEEVDAEETDGGDGDASDEETEEDETAPEDLGKAEATTAVQVEAAESATPDEVVASQAKSESGQRDPEVNPEPNAVAGQPDEDDEPVDDPHHFRNAGKVAEDEEGNAVRRRIDEDWEDPEPREVGRERTQADQFDYEVLPDGRKRKLVFEEPGDDDDEE